MSIQTRGVHMRRLLQPFLAVLAPLTQRVRLLAPQDRLLLLAVSILPAGFLLYMFAIVPMRQELAQLRMDVPADRIKLARMRDQAQQVAKLRTLTSRAGSPQEAVRTTVERTADQFGLRAGMRQFQDNSPGVQFDLDDVEADSLLRWLEELSNVYGIRAHSAQVDLLSRPGRVKAVLVLLGSVS